jgi:hypothetical protein
MNDATREPTLGTFVHQDWILGRAPSASTKLSWTKNSSPRSADPQPRFNARRAEP